MISWKTTASQNWSMASIPKIKKVALAVGKVLPNITQLIEKIEAQLRLGGRLFYMGAGTSGRLGILDASECPPPLAPTPTPWSV